MIRNTRFPSTFSLLFLGQYIFLGNEEGYEVLADLGVHDLLEVENQL